MSSVSYSAGSILRVCIKFLKVSEAIYKLSTGKWLKVFFPADPSDLYLLITSYSTKTKDRFGFYFDGIPLSLCL